MTHPLPDDIALRDAGLTASGQGRVLILACGALAREILTLIRLNGWDQADLQCLPAILHNTPDRITQAVEDAIAKHSEHYEKIFAAYADCGTGGLLQAACAKLGIDMIAGPHCYSFFAGNAGFGDFDEPTSFYLTDFLARQFDAFVWRPLGLDRHPDLRDIYFGNYEKLVYLAQTDDPGLTKTAQHCAARLGLSFERRFTGYGDLATTLEQWLAPYSPAKA